MATGIPVRLSEQLTNLARDAAAAANRSLTEQVEHWARLGRAVEDVVRGSTARRLKAIGQHTDIDAALAFARTPEGQAHAAAYIRERNSVLHEVDARGRVRAVPNPRRRRNKK